MKAAGASSSFPLSLAVCQFCLQLVLSSCTKHGLRSLFYSLLPDKTGTVADSSELACDVKTFCSISLLKSEMLHLLALLCLNGLL